MWCKNCGEKLKGNIINCPICGEELKKDSHYDNGDTAYSIISFFFPPIGLFLYNKWRYNQPNNAHAAGKGAIFGTIVEAIFILIELFVL